MKGNAKPQNLKISTKGRRQRVIGSAVAVFLRLKTLPHLCPKIEKECGSVFKVKNTATQVLKEGTQQCGSVFKVKNTATLSLLFIVATRRTHSHYASSQGPLCAAAGLSVTGSFLVLKPNVAIQAICCTTSSPTPVARSSLPTRASLRGDVFRVAQAPNHPVLT